ARGPGRLDSAPGVPRTDAPHAAGHVGPAPPAAGRGRCPVGSARPWSGVPMARRRRTMMDVVLEFEDGRRIPQRLALPLSIGRDEDSGLRIRAWRVARRHASIMMREGEVWIEDLGSLAGTEVNGRRIALEGPPDGNADIV